MTLLCSPLTAVCPCARRDSFANGADRSNRRGDRFTEVGRRRPCRRGRACAARPCRRARARSRSRWPSPAALWPRNSSISAPDQICPIGFAMPLPAMSGAEPCTGSNSDGNVALGIHVRGRRDADRAAHGGPEVGQYVAEEIGCDDDVEPLRPLHEVRGQDVDVELVGAHVRIARAVIARKRSSQYGIVIEMPLDLVADVRCFAARVRASSNAKRITRSTPLRENTDSWNTISRSRAFVHAAADRRILAFRVLAHHDEVDVARLAVGERRRDARHQLARPHVHVLVEVAAELDERAPQRHVVREPWRASRRRRRRSPRRA